MNYCSRFWEGKESGNILLLSADTMIRARILWIEAKRAASASLISGLRNKGYTVDAVLSVAEAKADFDQLKPDLIVLNSASFRTNGRRMCRSLRELTPSTPIIVITDTDKSIVGEASVNVVLELPFTLRKLLNRMTPLLPREQANVLLASPIRLDLKARHVSCNGRETRLTPRLVALLKMLMEHRGEVIERENLFRSVWDTSYTGDTRSLDVHISWLRQAIEEDPRNPILIKTVRGVGYRLDA